MLRVTRGRKGNRGGGAVFLLKGKGQRAPSSMTLSRQNAGQNVKNHYPYQRKKMGNKKDSERTRRASRAGGQRRKPTKRTDKEHLKACLTKLERPVQTLARDALRRKEKRAPGQVKNAYSSSRAAQESDSWTTTESRKKKDCPRESIEHKKRGPGSLARETLNRKESACSASFRDAKAV